MSKLSENATQVAENRYFMEGENWESCASRVGTIIASAENSKAPEYAEKFSEMIYNMDFLPGGRILRNAGRPRGSMFNCYHLPIGDSREEIGQFYKDSLILWGEGGGIGVNASSLRPKGAEIKGVGGESSGPVSFLRASDSIAETVESGGSRRAAALALMHVSHPDILRFIDAKLMHGELSHYNISVAVSEEFLAAVESNADWEFKFAQKTYGKVKAREIWNKIVDNMVRCAEPGILNWDNLIKNNSYYYDPVMGTNPSLRKGTRVITSEGIFAIEDLENKSIMVPNLNGEYSQANCILSGNNKKLYKITLEGQHIYYCTKEHKWPVVINNKVSKVETSDINSGDFIVYQDKVSSLSFGNVGSYKDGFIVGWNLGDGWITKRSDDGTTQIGFIVSEEDKLVGIHAIISEYLVNKCEWQGDFNNKNEINVNNKKLNEIFTMFDVQHKSKGLPLSVWTYASEEFRKGLIDGLFSADGCFSDKIVLTTAHKHLADDVCDLLGFYGLKCNINTQETTSTFPNGRDYGRKYVRYDLKIGHQNSIKHFNDIFKISHSNKKTSLQNLIKECRTYCENKIKIISVEKTDLVEDVWDLRVFDTTHCFKLAHCMTGNCGEAVLAPYDVCDLGSLVLTSFITGAVNTNWKKLKEIIKLAVRFLDDVIEINKYVLKEIDIKAHNSRRIGLGVMGLAEYLFAKKLRYGSERSIIEIERLMRFIRDTVYETLVELADEKGAFPKFEPVAYGKASFIRKLPASLRMDIKDHGVRCVTSMAIAPTGCQDKDTMIVTSDGLLTLEELGSISGDKWQDININVSQEYFQKEEKATKFYVNDRHATKKIYLDSGNTLESTYNHQYRVLQNSSYIWKRADELVVGDDVISVLDTYNKTSNPTLIVVDVSHHNQNEINTIPVMTEKLAEFLGIYFGDGSNHTKGIRISCNAYEEDNYLYVAELGFEVFGIKPTFYDNGRNCMEICFNSKLLLEFLGSNKVLKQKSNNISIPKLIRVSSKKCIQSFIKGMLFADGSKSGNTEYLDTSSEKLAKELLIIMRALGNDVRIRESVSGLGSKMFRLWIKKGVYKFRPKSEQLKKQQLDSLGLTNCVVDSIINIENSITETYDIEVPTTVTYIANSVVSHNTISLLADVTSGIEPLFRKAYLRHDRVGDRMYVHPIYKEMLLKGKKLENWYVDTNDLEPKDHFEMQSVVQKYVDGAVSKTINMPINTTPEELSRLSLEYIRDLKGMTVYVDGSREGQILNEVSDEEVRIYLNDDKLEITNAGEESVMCATGTCEI